VEIQPTFERGRYERTIYVRQSPHGTPYAVGICSNLSNGRQHTALVDSRQFNLDYLEYLEGEDALFTPTEKGLRLKPLTHQPDDLVARLIERLEQGPDPERARPPELVEDSNPPANPADDEINPVVPVVGEIISYVAKVSLENDLPAAGWCFLPPGASK